MSSEALVPPEGAFSFLFCLEFFFFFELASSVQLRVCSAAPVKCHCHWHCHWYKCGACSGCRDGGCCKCHACRIDLLQNGNPDQCHSWPSSDVPQKPPRPSGECHCHCHCQWQCQWQCTEARDSRSARPRGRGRVMPSSIAVAVAMGTAVLEYPGTRVLQYCKEPISSI